MYLSDWFVLLSLFYYYYYYFFIFFFYFFFEKVYSFGSLSSNWHYGETSLVGFPSPPFSIFEIHSGGWCGSQTGLAGRGWGEESACVDDSQPLLEMLCVKISGTRPLAPRNKAIESACMCVLQHSQRSCRCIEQRHHVSCPFFDFSFWFIPYQVSWKLIATRKCRGCHRGDRSAFCGVTGA